MEFVPGCIYHRQNDIHQKYGGQGRGGISTPTGRPDVFLFTGDAGLQYGYEDRFSPDGTYSYTGECQTGDMSMVRGNLAIKTHEQTGRSVHLFEYVSKGQVRRFVFTGGRQPGRSCTTRTSSCVSSS